MILAAQQLESHHSERQARPRDIALLCAADDRYVMPLAVTLRTTCEHLSPDCNLQIYLITAGLSEEHWAGLKETLATFPVTLHEIRCDAAAVQHLSVSHHVTHTAYFRLLAADLLPSSLQKVVYLDCDLYVHGDVAELWKMPLGENYCLAVPDIACPYVDARAGCANFRKASPFMAAVRPVPNYRELGMDGRSEYFNSGVMVLNLARWRAEQASRRLIDCLARNARHVWCWDQYALNVVFHGQWGRLPPRWNQGSHAFEYPTQKHSPIDAGEFIEMRDRPSIVHFTSEFKPWSDRCMHPLADLYFHGLDRTAWAGWRPSQRHFNLRRWCQLRGVDLQRQLTISLRRVAALI